MKKQNLFFSLLLLVFLGITIGPNLVNNLQQQGKKLEKLNATEIISSKTISFPPQGTHVVLFWATWCAPCKLEMKRLKSAIKDGDLPQERVWAYNPFENKDVIKNFITKNSYPFHFITTKPKLEESLNIRATPTYLWINEDKTIYRMTTGISFINLLWLEYFLN